MMMLMRHVDMKSVRAETDFDTDEGEGECEGVSETNFIRPTTPRPRRMSTVTIDNESTSNTVVWCVQQYRLIDRSIDGWIDDMV